MFLNEKQYKKNMHTVQSKISNHVHNLLLQRFLDLKKICSLCVYTTVIDRAVK